MSMTTTTKPATHTTVAILSRTTTQVVVMASCIADTQRYSNDVAKPDIKALKTRCDAGKAAAARKTKPADAKK